MDAALRKFDKIAGLPYEITTAPLSGGAQVAGTCKQNHVSIVYVTQGLDAKIADLVGALSGVDVLSVAAVARYVGQAVVLGFDPSPPSPRSSSTSLRRRNTISPSMPRCSIS